MNHLDSQYDPVRDYVDSALTAENRGGVQVSRTIDEKLKNKALQFSNYPKNSFPSALDFGGRTKTNVPFRCRKVGGGSTLARSGFKAVSSRLRPQLKETPLMNDKRKPWNDYWLRVSRASSRDGRQTIRRGIVFTGSTLKIAASRCVHERGVVGTVVRETRNTFTLSVARSKKNQGSKKGSVPRKLQTVVKAKRIFMLVLPDSAGGAEQDRAGREAGVGQGTAGFVLIHGDDLVRKAS